MSSSNSENESNRIFGLLHSTGVNRESRRVEDSEDNNNEENEEGEGVEVEIGEEDEEGLDTHILSRFGRTFSLFRGSDREALLNDLRILT